ncbi:MAG: quinoprotein dehydrogenase-associated SoxYZ-like carrier [Thiohalocapsa sp.]
MYVADLARSFRHGSRVRYSCSLSWRLLLGIGFLLFVASVQAQEQSDARWMQIKHELFGDRRVEDGSDTIGLDTPYRAEDAAVVPVGFVAKFDQTPERHIKGLWLVIDNNPSPVAAVFEFPGDRVWDIISTRIRVNAYTNVRALAELNDGSLHMTSNFVKASGGCSAPALKDPSAAAANLGRMKMIVPERQADSPLVAKLLIKHPNNSGLQFDQVKRSYIPADYVRNIEVSYEGELLFKVTTDISISEDPAIIFGFMPDSDASGAFDVQVVDSEGRRFDERFEPTAMN